MKNEQARIRAMKAIGEVTANDKMQRENERLLKVVRAAVLLEPHLDEIFKLFPEGKTSQAEIALARLGDYTNQYKMTAKESPAQGD